MQTSFRTPRDIIWGRGSFSFLKNIPGRKVLIITDKTMVRLGIAEKAENYLQKAGLEVRVFDEVEPEPSIETVREAVSEYRAYAPDVILGLGGGSCLDASKGFRIFFEHPRLSFEDIRYFRSPPKTMIPPFNRTTHIAIASTSGTGSDVSYACILNDPSIPAKCPILSSILIPDIAIVDPDIADSMPPNVLADTGLDALTHAIESYVNDKANDFSRGHSFQASILLMKFLPPAYLRQDSTAKEHVHYAATIAGIGFSNSSNGICHTIADKVGHPFKLSHGKACAIALPYTIKFNSPIAGDLFNNLAHAIGYNGDECDAGVDYLVQRIRQVRKQLNTPDSYKEAGISEESYHSRIKEFAVASESFPATVSNPRKATIEELENLYTSCYQGDYSKL